MTGDPFQDYRRLLEKIDRFAAQLRQAHPRSFACAPGCSSCCVGGITVWRIEHDFLAAALSVRQSDGPMVRQSHDVDHRTIGLSDYRTNKSTDHRTIGPTDGCRLLDEQHRCAIYEARPVVCRLWGLPILIPSGSEAEWGLRGHATAAAGSGGTLICCDLNFTGPPALADLPPTAPISARTVVTTLAAINHVYCRERGLDPEERLPLPAPA